MKHVTGLVSLTLLLSIAPASLQAQDAPRQDSSVAIIDSLRPRVIPRRVSPYQARRSCYGLSQKKCSIFGALMIGGIGYLAGDVSAPEPKYEYRYVNSFPSERKVCVKHCSIIPAKAIVFSLGGATIGGIGGWLTGRK